MNVIYPNVYYNKVCYNGTGQKDFFRSQKYGK